MALFITSDGTILVPIFFALLTCHIVSTSTDEGNLGGRLVYAVNAGGPPHTDIHGIFYEADHSTNGISSDYGKRFWTIGRVDPDDAILYQTERYGMSTFGYKIPIRDDGDYVLVLKFAEVYFLNPRKKVFDVFLNNVHQVVKDLDIFEKVGHGVAHDEIIPFSVKNRGQTLVVNGGDSRIRNNEILLQFIKGNIDNPKICAFYVIRGTVSDIPMLPPYDPKDYDPEGELHSSEIDYDLDVGNEKDEEVDDHDRSNMDEIMQAQKAKRRRRLTQRNSIREVEAYEDDWTGYIQVGGSIGIALLLAFAVKKIIS